MRSSRRARGRQRLACRFERLEPHGGAREARAPGRSLAQFSGRDFRLQCGLGRPHGDAHRHRDPRWGLERDVHHGSADADGERQIQAMGCETFVLQRECIFPICYQINVVGIEEVGAYEGIMGRPLAPGLCVEAAEGPPRPYIDRIGFHGSLEDVPRGCVVAVSPGQGPSQAPASRPLRGVCGHERQVCAGRPAIAGLEREARRLQAVEALRRGTIGSSRGRPFLPVAITWSACARGAPAAGAA